MRKQLYWLGKIKESFEAAQGDLMKLKELTRDGGKRRHAERSILKQH